jgi:exopolysaccharide biosynthesis protein
METTMLKKLFTAPVLAVLIPLSLVTFERSSGRAPGLNVPPVLQTCPAQWTCSPVASGVVWMKRTYTSSPYGDQVVNVLDIDPARTTLHALMAAPAGQYETVLSMGNRTKALAGVNGGYFCNYQDCNSASANGHDDICSAGGSTTGSNHAPCPPFLPRSLLQINGNTFSTNCAMRTSFGITTSGSPMIKQISASQGWSDVTDAIGAGPNLVSSGTKFVTTEGFDWYQQQAPRTAAALSASGHLLLVTVDGRYAGANGMTLDVLANFLLGELQAVSAMNFDGGGSTTMFVTGQGVVNKPSSGCNRSVYNGLFVFAK